MFNALEIAASGADVSQTWLDAIAHNLANLNTVRPWEEEPFRAKLVHAQEVIDGPGAAGSGATVYDIVESGAEPVVVYYPEHPFADPDGNVTLPVVDMAAQMSDLIVAQRSYQMNLQVIRNSREAYESALRIGRS